MAVARPLARAAAWALLFLGGAAASDDLDSLRAEVRRARIERCPGAIRAAEQAYHDRLDAEAASLPLRHLVAARHPLLSRRVARSPEERFWLGLAAFEDERWEEAAALWSEEVPPYLRPHAEWLRVKALGEIDPARGGEAALALVRTASKHRFRSLLLLRAGRHLIATGRCAEARRLLAAELPALARDASLAARGYTLLAEASLGLKDRAAFEEAFRRASVAAVTGAEGEDRREQAARLLSRGRRLPADVRGASLLSLVRLAAPGEAYEAWKRHGSRVVGGDSLRILPALLRRLYQAGDDRALRELAGQVVRHGASECRQAAQLTLGRLHRREGRLEAMERAYRAGAGEGQPGRAALALWELGRELEDSGRWAGAAAAFDELAARFPEDDRHRAARFRSLLCRHAGGEVVEEGLEALCTEADGRHVGRPCLWRALLGRPAEREVYLAAAAAEKNPGYDARRAAAERDREEPSVWVALAAEVRDRSTWAWPRMAEEGDPAPADRLLALVADHPLAEAGICFRAFGYRRWAGALWRDLPGWNALGAAERGALYRALGAYGASIREGMRTGNLGDRYPVAYSAEVEEAAGRFGFHPAFLLAVMRQESLLEPTARSRAGAIGLMQLMPATARRLADSLGMGEIELERPRDNILLGACHLDELLRRAGGAVPMALAAYNAGWPNAERWLRDGDDWDAYIEGITYAETRRFVKSVLMHYWCYVESYPALTAPPPAGSVGQK